MATEYIMILFQFMCMIEAALNGYVYKALYWFGAILLTIAVIKGLKT